MLAIHAAVIHESVELDFTVPATSAGHAQAPVVEIVIVVVVISVVRTHNVIPVALRIATVLAALNVPLVDANLPVCTKPAKGMSVASRLEPVSQAVATAAVAGVDFLAVEVAASRSAVQAVAHAALDTSVFQVAARALVPVHAKQVILAVVVSVAKAVPPVAPAIPNALRDKSA